MRAAFGILGWPPAAFWEATVTEYMTAVEGFNLANGAKRDEPITDDELDALVARYG